MEQWKEISGYEGYYEVSNQGSVRSITRTLTDGRLYQGRIIAQKTMRNGYKQVHLSKGNKTCWNSVHRLVAEAFIPNPEGLPQVNHKDEDKQNNHVSNLEWFTASDNCKYGHRNETMIEKRRKKITAISFSGETLLFPSIQEAARQTGVSAGHICSVCKGERNNAGGYSWQYAK